MEIPRLPEGCTRTPQDRDRIANAVLDAIEVWRLSELEPEFDREPRDTSGLPTWSAASADWLGAQPTIADRERELAALTEWLDRLIDRLPDDDDAA